MEKRAEKYVESYQSHSVPNNPEELLKKIIAYVLKLAEKEDAAAYGYRFQDILQNAISLHRDIILDKNSHQDPLEDR